MNPQKRTTEPVRTISPLIGAGSRNRTDLDAESRARAYFPIPDSSNRTYQEYPDMAPNQHKDVDILNTQLSTPRSRVKSSCYRNILLEQSHLHFHSAMASFEGKVVSLKSLPCQQKSPKSNTNLPRSPSPAQPQAWASPQPSC